MEGLHKSDQGTEIRDPGKIPPGTVAYFGAQAYDPVELRPPDGGQIITAQRASPHEPKGDRSLKR